MNSFKLTPTLFFIGSLGGLLCVLAWFQTSNASWLWGMAVASAFLTWSIVGAILATRRDLQEWRRNATLEEVSADAYANRKEQPLASKPLRQNGYFRAGIMGLPFCVVEWFWRHELIFLFGSGFFAAMLIPALYAHWKWNRDQKRRSIQSI